MYSWSVLPSFMLMGKGVAENQWAILEPSNFWDEAIQVPASHWGKKGMS